MFFLFQLSVRGKNKKEKLEDFFKNMVKSADGVIVSGVKVILFKQLQVCLKMYSGYSTDSLSLEALRVATNKLK